MPLTSNAAPDELDSPFYIENEKLCNAWNDYITEKNGQLNGIYNAWSFDIKSKVTTNRSWLINVKKSTYSSGNLLLSSKYQNLQESLMFRANDFNTNCGDFRIKKSRFRSSLRRHPFSKSILELLNDAIQDKSLYEVSYKDSLLTIVFHHKNDWFKMADRILAFDPDSMKA